MTNSDDVAQAQTHYELAAPQQDKSSPQPVFIVGIGASAGGLEAFTTFLTHMPPDSGIAFVLVQYLDPQHPSLLPELLAPHTAMPVLSIVDHLPVAADHVYLIPPNTTLTIDRGVLHLAPRSEAHGHQLPIDHFFHSLAADQGTHAIGIILSGSGTDGTLGLVAIKEHGGMTMAQVPETARYDTMPQSAIAREVVDHVLPIEQMPAMLLAYAQHRTSHPPFADSGPPQVETTEELRAICAILRQRTGHDFSHYKPASLLRRITHRMQVIHIDELADYVKRLRQDQQEVDDLFQNLLIGVMHFFRDSAAFDALANTVIPKLFRNKGTDVPVHVWVPGCATGEEAYSIAILLREHLVRRGTFTPVQIFATDIDEQALKVARQGWYDERIVEDVSAERLARFFVRNGHGYQVTKALRELCLFAVHNLLSDPPFAKMELIACCNLLSCFDAAVQRKLVPLLHYALVPEGYLFLGPSESAIPHPGLFRMVDERHHIFQRKDPLVRPSVDFPFPELSRQLMRRAEAAQRALVRTADIVSQPDKPIARQLAQELQITREGLETTIEELRTSNEELHSAYEEIHSINEELQTVNDELTQKIKELDRANSDLQNLLSSTQILAIFLHADGRIARFTPAAKEVFYLIETDIGRPLTDIAPRFRDSNLPMQWSEVLRTLTAYEEPVRSSESNTWWIMRIQPYQTLDNVIDGVVITFSDITKLKQAEDALEERVQARTRELTAANVALQAEITERKRAEAAVRESETNLAAVNAALQTEINQRAWAEQGRQLLLRQLVTAQEEERRRIARELHDQLGQDLTVLLLGLKALRDTYPDDAPIHERVAPLQALAARMGQEVRTLALELRPPALDDLGLVATLSNYVEQWSARTLIAVDFQPIGLTEQRLPSLIETALYRLAQEALTNVLKHAHATSVSLILEQRVDVVQLIIEDNGVGFDVETVRSNVHTERRLGLVGMEERVAQLGGMLLIESSPSRGTTVFVRIPLIEAVQGGTHGANPDLSGR